MMEECNANKTYVLAQMALIDVEMGELKDRMKPIRYRIFTSHRDDPKWRCELLFDNNDVVVSINDKLRELQGSYEVMDALRSGMEGRQAVMSREITRRMSEMGAR
jgi:hypothetical protein